MPFGGLKMVQDACKVYNVELNPEVSEIFTKYRKTHNQGVFDVYTPDIRRCRKSGVITGLPDAYGRGRIIGDYRRVALYGIDFLMKDKLNQFNSLQADLENGCGLGRSHPPSRRDQRTIQSLGSNERNGGFLRLRHFRPCKKCTRSDPMDLLRLPRCR